MSGTTRVHSQLIPRTSGGKKRNTAHGNLNPFAATLPSVRLFASLSLDRIRPNIALYDSKRYEKKNISEYMDPDGTKPKWLLSCCRLCNPCCALMPIESSRPCFFTYENNALHGAPTLSFPVICSVSQSLPRHRL